MSSSESLSLSRASAVLAFLSSQPAADFKSPTAVVSVSHLLSAASTLKLLRDADVTGAPVYKDESTVAGQTVITRRKYVGFVDVSDLALLITSKGLERPEPEGFLAKVGNLFSTDWEHTAGSAVNLSKHDPFYGLPLDGNLAQAARVFAQGVHRVAVLDQHDGFRLVGVVTASSVLRLLCDNLGVLGQLAALPVGTLFPTGAAAVTSCSQHDTARHCFNALVHSNHLGMPVCNDDGAIVANFSASDVRHLATLSPGECVAALGQSVLAFLSFVGAAGADKGAMRAPLTVTPADRLDTVIRLLVAACVHRLYIVDAGQRRIGIVSVTDVLALLLAPSVLSYGDDTPFAAPVVPASVSLASSPTDRDLVVSLLRPMTAELFVARSGVPLSAVYDLHIDATVADALALFARHNVHALAVYDTVPVLLPGIEYGFGSGFGHGYVGDAVPVTEKKYIGWLDTADVTKLLLERGIAAQAAPLLSLSHWFGKDVEHAAGAAVNFSQADPFYAVDMGRPMTQVFRVLAKNVHRVAVIDIAHQRRIKGIITQSSAVSFLAEHKSVLGSLASTTLGEVLRSIPRPVVTCLSSASTHDAFNVMLTNSLTGMPVVDDSGAIVANVSLTDVRRLSTCTTDAELQDALDSNVLEYLRRPVVGSAASPSLSPLVLHPTDSLGTAIELLTAAHVHRVYVIDQHRHPIGVLSLSLVLQAVAELIQPASTASATGGASATSAVVSSAIHSAGGAGSEFDAGFTATAAK